MHKELLNKLFRDGKLGENAGYGVDKTGNWAKQAGCEVIFRSGFTHIALIYKRPLNSNVSDDVPERHQCIKEAE